MLCDNRNARMTERERERESGERERERGLDNAGKCDTKPYGKHSYKETDNTLPK